MCSSDLFPSHDSGGLGSLQVVSIFGNEGINWAESFKLKQQIIDEGKIPYQAFRDENGQIVGDNGGLKWFVGYGNDYSYLWRWKRQRHLKTLKEIIYYRFSPTQDQYRSLYRIINANPLQHHFISFRGYERVVLVIVVNCA